VKLLRHVYLVYFVRVIGFWGLTGAFAGVLEVNGDSKTTKAKTKAKCGGLSTAAAKAPPSVEMTVFFGSATVNYKCKYNGDGSVCVANALS
jgi:hypothetical protein